MMMWRNDKGFTLVEVLAVVAILGAIMGVMSMSVISIMRIAPANNDRAVALRQVQNAGYWITRDILTASDVNVDSDPGTPQFLTLTVPLTPATDKTVVYELQTVSGTIKKLMRIEQDTGQQRLIAEKVFYDPPSPDSTGASYVSPEFTLTVTAIVSGAEKVSRQYAATQRVLLSP